MRNRWLIFASLVLTGSILIGCGSAAEAPRSTFEPTNTFDFSVRVTEASVVNKGGDVEVVAVIPTDTPAPTETPIPLPTDTPEPTATSIPPTETPVPTEEPAAGVGDAANGEILFHDPTNLCSTCHNADTDATLVGPGMLGVGERAATRVEGMSAYDYLHQSIVEPDAFTVEGFTPGLMPATFSMSLTEDQINDIIAYLLTR